MWKMSENGGISVRIAPLSGQPDLPILCETGSNTPPPDRVPGDRVAEMAESMRHRAFFTELASLGDADPSWRAVTAGLVVLRLVEAWVEEGAGVVAADSWGVRSVRTAIEDMPEGMPARTLLSGVVDALISARSGDLPTSRAA